MLPVLKVYLNLFKVTCSMKSGTNKMTTGNPLKLMITFAIPIMLTSLMHQFYNVADTYIVGKYISDDALAAVGAVGPMSGLLVGLAMGLTDGFSIPVAQSFGAGNKKLTNHYIGNAISLTVVATAVMTVVSFVFMKPILRLMGTPDNIFADAYTYVIVTYLGMFTRTIYNVLAGVLRAMGDSKAPLMFLTGCAIANVVFNYITIVPLKMGVFGAAISTVFAQFIACVMCIIYVKKRNDIIYVSREDLRIKKETAILMLKMGVPRSLQYSITSIGSMVLQTTINSYGSDYVAGWTVANKPELLTNIPLSATGVAVATFSGQNFGAGKMDRVRKGVVSGMIFAGCLSVMMSFILYFFGDDISGLFLDVDNANALFASKTYLQTIAIFYFAVAVLFVFRNALQGIGKSYVSMMAGVAELLGRIVAALILSKYLGFVGVCLASPVAWIFADIPLIVIYYLKVVKRKDKECLKE